MQTEKVKSAADLIHEGVEKVLARAAIFYAVQSAGAGLVRDGWHCDGWRVDFSRGANMQGYARPDESGAFPKAARESFEYFTGLGHRRSKGRRAFKSEPEPVAPHVAGVLHSLILDSEAGALSFSDFCDTFGYSNDSLKALDTYRACEETARRVRAFFPAATLAALRDILADY